MLPLIWSYCSSACCNQFSNNALFVSKTEVEWFWFLLLEDLYSGKPIASLCTCRWSVKYSHLVILTITFLYKLKTGTYTGYCMCSRTNKAQFHMGLCPVSLHCSNTGISPLCPRWPHCLLPFPPCFHFIFSPCSTSSSHLTSISLAFFCPFTCTVPLPWISFGCLRGAQILFISHYYFTYSMKDSIVFTNIN